MNTSTIPCNNNKQNPQPDHQELILHIFYELHEDNVYINTLRLHDDKPNNTNRGHHLHNSKNTNKKKIIYKNSENVQYG